MNKIAIYDMDKTITINPTYSGFLFYIARHHAPWRLIALPLVALLLLGYAIKLIDRARLKEINQRLLIGQPEYRAIAPLLQRHAQKTLADNIRPDALEQIRRDRQDGYTLVMATASYLLYARDIAELLGFDAVIATGLKQDQQGRILAKITGENCYGPAKLSMILAWLDEQSLAPDDCEFRCYSDHISDLPMLALSAAPVATNAHQQLRAEAAKRGWQIIDWPA